MKISAIMPTRARADFALGSLKQWQRQTWHKQELIIIDDDDVPSFPNGVDYPGVTYVRQPRATIGRKRNQACELATGDIICHWDDDDYSSPTRMEEQATLMLATGAPVVGFNSMVFRDGEDRYLYTGSPLYAIGTSLFYRKWYWERLKFVEIQYLPDGTLVAEDNMFVARSAACIACAPAGDLMWARIHSGNTSGLKGQGNCWRKL